MINIIYWLLTTYLQQDVLIFILSAIYSYITAKHNCPLDDRSKKSIWSRASSGSACVTTNMKCTTNTSSPLTPRVTSFLNAWPWGWPLFGRQMLPRNLREREAEKSKNQNHLKLPRLRQFAWLWACCRRWCWATRRLRTCGSLRVC